MTQPIDTKKIMDWLALAPPITPPNLELFYGFVRMAEIINDHVIPNLPVEEPKIIGCPFCHDNDTGLVNLDNGSVCVSCHNCRASGPTRINLALAVKSWNKRNPKND